MVLKPDVGPPAMVWGCFPGFGGFQAYSWGDLTLVSKRLSPDPGLATVLRRPFAIGGQPSGEAAWDCGLWCLGQGALRPLVGGSQSGRCLH